jgi:hypothetical protein
LFATTYDADDQMILDNVGSTNYIRAIIGSTGTLGMLLQHGTNAILTYAGSLNDGLIHEAKLTYDKATGDAELFVDGVSRDTDTWTSDENNSLTWIGFANEGALPYDGYLMDVTLTDLADPTNSRKYALNSGSITTEEPVLGSGTLTYSDVDAGDWDDYRRLYNRNAWVSLDDVTALDFA